jgi:hypothetical protein
MFEDFNWPLKERSSPHGQDLLSVLLRKFYSLGNLET